MSRFHDMISVMNNTFKRGVSACNNPTNNMTTTSLRTFRESGYIFGFLYIPYDPDKPYPRCDVSLKFTEKIDAPLKKLQSFNNTSTQFRTIRKGDLKKMTFEGRIFLLTNSLGINLFSFKNYVLSANEHSIYCGKILAEITV